MINKCFRGWCHQQNFEGFDLGELHMALGLLATDGVSEGENDPGT